MVMKIISASCLIAAALVLGGCFAVPVTPGRLEAEAVNRPLAKAELATWSQAIALCNEFLKSDPRQTLPPGAIAFERDSMVFNHEGGSIALAVKCTTFGDILVLSHMAAQERPWGFVVGSTKPHGGRLTDNSLFRYRNGAFVSDIGVADVILHELTHIYCKSSLDNPWEVIRYYAEACFLLRYRNHSMERLPFRTTAEFYAYIAAIRKAHPEWFSPMPAQPKPSA